MEQYSVFSEDKLSPSLGHASCTLLSAEQGCIGACAAGISVYSSREYSPVQEHPFQEGFYVIEGCGSARVGNNAFKITGGTCFFVPSGTDHAIRCTGDKPVKVFWFHSA